MISLSWFKTTKREREKRNLPTSKSVQQGHSQHAFRERFCLHRLPGAFSCLGPRRILFCKAVPESGLPVTLKTNLKVVWIWIWRMLSWAISSWSLTEYQITQKIQWMYLSKEIKKNTRCERPTETLI